MLASVLEDRTIDADIRQQIKVFLSGGGVVQTGVGMYPQFFPPGYGMLDDPEGLRRPEPFPRLVFNLIGKEIMDITLPVAKKPRYFPNAADVLVLLCPSSPSNPPDPLAVAVFSSDGKLGDVYLRSPLPDGSSCADLSNN